MTSYAFAEPTLLLLPADLALPSGASPLIDRFDPYDDGPGVPSAAIVACAALSPAGAARLVGWNVPTLALVDDRAGDADAAGLLLALADVAFVDRLSATVVGGFLADVRARLGLVEAYERATVFAPARAAPDVETLRRDAERLAAALAALSAEAAGTGPRPVDAAFVRALLRARRLRERHLPAELFADPAWDMLLDLSLAARERTRVSVSSLCIAGHVPTTTGLRYVKLLTDAGLIERTPDPDDARRCFVGLTPIGTTAMDAALAAIAEALSG